MTMLTRRAALAGLAMLPAAAAIIAAPAAADPHADAALLDLAHRFAEADDALAALIKASDDAAERAHARYPDVPPEIAFSRWSGGATQDGLVLTREMVDMMFAFPQIAAAVGDKIAERERKRLCRLIGRYEKAVAAIRAEEGCDEHEEAFDACVDRRHEIAQEILAIRPTTTAGVLAHLWFALDYDLSCKADEGRREIDDARAAGGSVDVGLSCEHLAAEAVRVAFEQLAALAPAPLPPFAKERQGETGDVGTGIGTAREGTRADRPL